MKLKLKKAFEIFSESDGVKQQLAFDSLLVSIPCPKPLSPDGEDASFAISNAIGVFDGVSESTQSAEINAGSYAWRLAKNIEQRLQSDEKASNLSKVVRDAVKSNDLGGSSTVCISLLHKKKLHALSIGDSGFVIVRDNNIIYNSPVQRHRSGAPYCVSFQDHADLYRAEVATVKVQKDDIVIMATDGLWDNVFATHILDIISHFQDPKRGPSLDGLRDDLHELRTYVSGEQPALSQTPSWKYMTSIANSLGKHACATSHSFTMDSPHAHRLFERYNGFTGGKMDDITFCVAKITDRQQTYQHRIHATCAIRSPDVRM